MPGGRFVIASDDDGTIDPSAQSLLPLIPIPYVTSEAGRLGTRAAGSERGAAGAAPRASRSSLDDSRAVIRGGYGIFLNQWAYSVQTAFARNLPFFFTKQVDVPSDVQVPTLQTRNILTSNATGTVGGSIMDYAYNVEYSQTWSGGLQYQLLPDHDGGGLVHGDVDARRRQRDRPQRAGARARARFRRAGRFRS